MTNFSDIIRALQAAIAAAEPESVIYTHVVPTGFERPSVLIEGQKVTMPPDSVTACRLEFRVKLTIFGPVNDYYDTALIDELYDRLQTLLRIFACQYVRVGDRAIKFSAPPQGDVVGLDYGEIVLAFQWWEDMSEMSDIPRPGVTPETGPGPMMESVELGL